MKTRNVSFSLLAALVLIVAISIISCPEVIESLMQVAKPTFTPTGGLYFTPQNISITCQTEGATIRYTTDGSIPNPTNGTIYNTAVPIGENTELKAVAYKEGLQNSQVAQEDYYIDIPQVKKPTLNPPPPYNFGSSLYISLSTQTSGATILYTIDGSEPTRENSLVYHERFRIFNSHTVKTFAYKEGMQDSEVASGAYSPTQVYPPEFSHYGDEPNSFDLEMWTETLNADIFYTLDGSDPTQEDGILYSEPIPFTEEGNYPVRAKAYKTNLAPSSEENTTIQLHWIVAKPPVFNPVAGEYTEAMQVSISCATPNTKIRYTTNGTDPSETLGILYNGPFRVGHSQRVKAIVYGEELHPQEGSARYSFKGPAGGFVVFDKGRKDNDYGSWKDGALSTEGQAGSDWQYIELAPVNYSSIYLTDAWNPFGDEDPYYQFYPTDNDLSSAIPNTSPYIGMGAQNTTTIYNALNQFENDFGAKACYEFSLSADDQSYDDWVLPSIEELQLIYENLFLLWLGDLDPPDTSLWSDYQSSTTTDGFHDELFMRDGRIAETYNKTGSGRIRPIRYY